MEQSQKTDNGATMVTVAGQKRLTLSGALSVDGFSETEITLTLPEGRLLVTGETLRISDFTKESGSLTAEGKILSLRFATKKEPLLKKLLK